MHWKEEWKMKIVRWHYDRRWRIIYTVFFLLILLNHYKRYITTLSKGMNSFSFLNVSENEFIYQKKNAVYQLLWLDKIMSFGFVPKKPVIDAVLKKGFRPLEIRYRWRDLDGSPNIYRFRGVRTWFEVRSASSRLNLHGQTS